MSDRNETQSTANAETQQIVKLLTAQRDLYGLLGRLADRQRSLITGNDSEKLLKVLAERQKVITALGQVTEALKPYQQRWQEIRGRMSSVDLSVVDELVAELQKRLASIIAKDEADVQLLAARKETAAEDLKSIKRNREAGAAYAASASGAATGTEWADS